MDNPVPENAPGTDAGDLVAVTVVGRLRTSVDGAVTVEVADVQEPVLRLPWEAVLTVNPVDIVTPDAYDWAAAREEVRL